MKLSKSKQALAKVINENGGWADDSVYAANDDGGIICGYSSKPIRRKTTPYHWSGSERNTWIRGIKTPQWHQCVLSREEYYQAYPKADADGWIEWKGGECPVSSVVRVDTKHRYGRIDTNRRADSAWWNHAGGVGDIVAYRLRNHANMHDTGAGDPNPVAEPEFCESVMSSIQEHESIDGSCAKVTEENKHQHVDAKPTIEQLAQDYRNKLDFANSKQQEADDAKAAADAALGELGRAGEEIGLLLSPIREGKKPEINIIDWRDLMVGDEIICSEDGNWNCDLAGNVCVVREIESQEYTGCMPILAEYCDASYWGDKFTFVRRP